MFLPIVLFFIGNVALNVAVETSTNNLGEGKHVETNNADTSWKNIVDALTKAYLQAHLGKKDIKCLINTRELSDKHPILVDPLDHTKFLYPNENGFLAFEEYEEIFLSCSGFGNHFQSTVRNSRYDRFRCVEEQIFRDSYNYEYDFQNLTCIKKPEYEVQKIVYGPNRDMVKFQVGLSSDDKAYVPLQIIHYDNKTMTPTYALSIISEKIVARQEHLTPANFDQTEYSTRPELDLDLIYTPEYQLMTLSKQLGCKNTCGYLKFLNLTFTPGFLVPNNSFVYKTAGDATNLYLNSIPMLKSVKNGNWEKIQAHINKMPIKLNKSLTIYTGASGNFSLKYLDERVEDALYLFAEDGKRFIAVPEFFWTIAYDHLNRTGVAFVTINNPLIDNRDDMIKCKKPITKSDLLELPENWSPSEPSLGFSYMCSVSDFLETSSISINNIQHLKEAVGLLQLPKQATAAQILRDEPVALPVPQALVDDGIVVSSQTITILPKKNLTRTLPDAQIRNN